VSLRNVKQSAAAAFFAVVTVLFAAAQSGPPSDLDPPLRELLTHDASCGSPGDAPATDGSTSQNLPKMQVVHGASGRSAGVIAMFSGCHCTGSNCSTGVYLKSDEGYHRVLVENLASLRAMRAFKHGLPDLTGTKAVSELVTETVVYEWDGSQYQPAICATITRKAGGRPLITKHACSQTNSTN